MGANSSIFVMVMYSCTGIHINNVIMQTFQSFLIANSLHVIYINVYIELI